MEKEKKNVNSEEEKTQKVQVKRVETSKLYYLHRHEFRQLQLNPGTKARVLVVFNLQATSQYIFLCLARYSVEIGYTRLASNRVLRVKKLAFKTL